MKNVPRNRQHVRRPWRQEGQQRWWAMTAIVTMCKMGCLINMSVSVSAFVGSIDLRHSSVSRPHIASHRMPLTVVSSFSEATDFEKPQKLDLAVDEAENDAWEAVAWRASRPYVSLIVQAMEPEELQEFLAVVQKERPSMPAEKYVEPERVERIQMRMARDPLWEQVKLEAKERLEKEPLAGPQLYQLILSQPSLLDAVVAIVAHEIETELMPAPSLRGLCLEFLHHEDNHAIHLDVVAAALRSPSDGTSALTAILFNKGLHALVCYRVGHNMWKAGRTGLAYYMQSTVSLKYSADIHPAAQIGSGIYLNCGGGVVIGETAVVGNDVILLQGVTLGGTGKEAGDRHPKIGNGVLLHDGVTVLGNIQVGDGAVITAKSIVTKAVPPLARVSGIPAKVKSYRQPIPSNNGNTSIDTNDHLIGLEQQIYANYNPLGQQS